MATKTIIQERVLKLEAALEAFKNEYPRNMADCWRKRTPSLVMYLTIILSFGLFATNLIGGMIVLVVFPVIFYISSKSRKEQNYKKFGAETQVRGLLFGFKNISDQKDIEEYIKKTEDSVNKISDYKNNVERKSSKYFSIILIVASIWSATAFVYNLATERGINENFVYLDMKIGDTFKASQYKVSQGLNTNDTITLRIEDHDKDPYFRFAALNLKIDGASENDIVIIKFVDKKGLPFPYFPEFIINAKDANGSKELYSSSQRSLVGEERDNFIILKTIKEEEIFFTLEKMRQ